MKRQIETINQYVETPGQSRIVEVYYCIICNCLESKQYFYFIFHNTCIEELGNKNKLTVNSGSNYKSLQLQDSFLEFNKFKHLQQKLTKFSGVSGYLVFRKTATYKYSQNHLEKIVSVKCVKTGQSEVKVQRWRPKLDSKLLLYMILTKSYYFLLTLPSVCETGQQKVTCSMSTIQTLEKAGDTFKVLTKTIY